MRPDRPRIALIGCGRMGGALLRGWMARGVAERIDVVEPHSPPVPGDIIHWHKSPGAFIKGGAKPDIVVIAVKPQIMDVACASIKSAVAEDSLILSIAAGQSIAGFESRFGEGHPIIRVMPNTPAAIGKGVSVAVANKSVTPAQKQTATALLEAAGSVAWIEDETLMDAVTALSGSGPAYVFYLIEVLALAGERCGLPADLAMTLARQTVIGSAALAETDAATPASTLRENVTSPNGTTAAALTVLKDSREMQDLFNRALAAATKRSKELNQ